MRVLHRRDQVAQVGLHLRGVARRAVEQRVVVDLVGARGAHRAQRDLRPAVRVHGVAPLHAHRGAVLVGDPVAVRHDRGHGAAAIAQHEPELLAAAQLAHQQDQVQLLPVDQLPHDHGIGR
mgnify:CR=1 FL=1